MTTKAIFDEKLEDLDITLFSQVLSQTTDGDRRSLLAIQTCARNCFKEYVYLEIGSYLGGSLQPHLLDPKCKRIYSIDKRQSISPDERVEAPAYPGNTRANMIARLSAFAPDQVKKMECIDGDTASIEPSRIQDRPGLCFIDGEHTPSAVGRDFEFCMKVCTPDAIIVLHDAQTIFRGLRSIVSRLKRSGREFSEHALADMIYAICLGGNSRSPLLARLDSQARPNDLWSPRNDLRLLKWRALAFKQRASVVGARLFRRNSNSSDRC